MNRSVRSHSFTSYAMRSNLHTYSRRQVLQTATALGVTSIMLAPRSTRAWQSTGEPKTLVVGFQYDVNHMDPAELGPIETDVAYKIYSNLVRVRPGTLDEFDPDLAERWTVSEDGRTYEFNLRAGVQWHKGYGQVTANDVKFTFDRLKTDALASPHQPEAQAISEVVVVNDLTVEVRLLEPWPDFLRQFVAYRPGFIVSQVAVTESGDRFGESAIGSGPYVLSSLLQRSEVVVDRNPDFYDTQPYFDTIRYSIILEEPVLAVALEQGDIDLFYALDPIVASSLIGRTDINAQEFGSNRTHFCYANLERAPTDDVRVRQAIWWALDKQAIADVGFEGLAIPIETILNPSIPEYDETTIYQYDPDRALQLLGEANFDFDTPLLMPIDSDDTITEVMAALLQDIGMRVETPVLERLAHVDAMTNGDFHVGVRALLRTTADQYYSRLLPSGNIPYPNASRYNNSDVDALIAQARSELDANVRRELYLQLQTIVQEEVPYIPLVCPTWVLASALDIEGAIPGDLRVFESTISRIEG